MDNKDLQVLILESFRELQEYLDVQFKELNNRLDKLENSLLEDNSVN
jgi:DNA-binding Lrp family transcriptional regulator